MAYKNKYQRQKQQYSTDGGSTWFDVSPANYRRGRLIEEASEDCNTVEWREVTGSWFCIEFAETVYRWVDSGTYDCAVGDKYPIEKEQVSNNGGSSWEDTGETRYGEVIRNSADCSIDYDEEYFTIEIMSDTATIYVNHNGLLEYKIDNGDWQVCSTSRNTINATLGQKIQWRGRLVSNNTSGCSFDNVFVTSNNTQIKVYGNINSVYEYDTLTNTCYNYSGFFNNNDGLIDAENLILPAETLIQYAYLCMFNGCKNLVTPPELPSTTLANDCYSQMFKGCISMTTAPELPATTLTWGCYYQMFGRCKSLTSAPDLPATSLAEGCYAQMFQECTSLVNAPSTLPATRVYNGSYQGMFKKCIALTTAPQILATTLDDNCFWEMFRDCVNLVNIPLTLPATTLADYCYHSMFEGCTSLTTAPILPAGTFVIDGDNVANYAYYEMFQGCTSLNYIKMMIANVPTGYNLGNFTSSWVYQVAATGTFVKNGGATWNEIGNDGVPRGWTIVYDGSGTRWVDSGTTVCQGRDKYTVEKEQVTTDGGQTWTDTGDTRTGTLIQRDSQDCLYASDYLTITSLADNNNIYWWSNRPSSASMAGNVRTIYISTDNGATWTSKMSQRNQISIATLNTGDKLLIKGTNTSFTGDYSNSLSSDYTVDISGNIMSMLYDDNFEGQTELTERETFMDIFRGLKIVNAENLVLPAITLANKCYKNMFQGCTTMVTAPKLPAINLTEYCYSYMFYGCSSLVNAPQLPSTTLAPYCYEDMFYECTSLTAAPTLPATTLTTGCYYYMFKGCSNMLTATELPATTLAGSCYYMMFYGCSSLITAPTTLPATMLLSDCYRSMFEGCTSLTTAPALPATTLAERCYSNMFKGCTSLVNAPTTLPATTLERHCYASMFEGCRSLVTAPQLPATTLVYGCYNYMFYDCPSLNYIKAMFATTPDSSYTKYWVYGVAASGTFVKWVAASWNVTGSYGVPTGWTVETASE